VDGGQEPGNREQGIGLGADAGCSATDSAFQAKLAFGLPL